MTENQIDVFKKCEEELRLNFPDVVISVSTGVPGELASCSLGDLKVCLMLAGTLKMDISRKIAKLQ